MDQSRALTYAAAPRQSGLYAEIGGQTFRASAVNGDPGAVLLFWRGEAGTAPAGFEPTETGTAAVRRDLRMRDLDRLYRLTVSCDYRGTGPFLVVRVDSAADGTVGLQVTYQGDDRARTLAQPGLRSMPELRAMRDPDIVGVVALSEAEPLYEQVEDVPLPGRSDDT